MRRKVCQNPFLQWKVPTWLLILTTSKGDVTVLLKTPAKPTHIKLWELVSLLSVLTEAITVWLSSELSSSCDDFSFFQVTGKDLFVQVRHLNIADEEVSVSCPVQRCNVTELQESWSWRLKLTRWRHCTWLKPRGASIIIHRSASLPTRLTTCEEPTFWLRLDHLAPLQRIHGITEQGRGNDSLISFTPSSRCLWRSRVCL